jgi:hypothetical protein
VLGAQEVEVLEMEELQTESAALQILAAEEVVQEIIQTLPVVLVAQAVQVL